MHRSFDASRHWPIQLQALAKMEAMQAASMVATVVSKAAAMAEIEAVAWEEEESLAAVCTAAVAGSAAHADLVGAEVVNMATERRATVAAEVEAA